MHIIVFAFNHYDNVLSYVDPIVKFTDVKVTVVLIVHGNRFFTGAFEKDLSNVKYGLMTENVISTILPPELQNYFEPELEIWFLKLSSLKVTVKNIFRSIWHIIKLAIKTYRSFDVYHFNGVGLYSLFLSYILKSRKRILTIHDYISHSGEGNDLISWSNKRLVRNFNHFIQHYEYLSKEMAKYFKLKESQVHTVRSGTFDFFTQFSTIPSKYSNYVLFFGRISPYKGLKYLVEAFVQYCQKYNNLDLVIAGGGNVSDVRALIDEEPRIHLINSEVSIYELSGLIQGCKYVICPYTDVSHSGVILHAYTYGKPVIANNLGGLHEVILAGKTGMLIDGLSKETIINSLLSLPDDPLAYEIMRKNIEDLTQNGILSWIEIAHEYKKVYTLVNQH